MGHAALHRKEYKDMKDNLITDIWFFIKNRDGASLEMGERKGIPALVVSTIDDQESEVIDELVVKDSKVIAIASSYYDNVNEYDLEEFEVPFLIDILDSVEKHLEFEKKEKKKKK